MNRPETQSDEAGSTDTALPPPAPIRLVEAFRSAVRASVPEREPSREALSVELLVIAGIASFEALVRLDDLSRAVEREANSSFPVDRSDVELANDRWLETAEILRYRLSDLRYEGYESESISVFLGAIRRASEIGSEAKERDRLERQALRASDLAALAARLKPRQDVYDVEGEG